MCVIYFKIAQEVSESRNEFMQRVKTKQVPEQLSSKTQTIHSDSKSTPDYFTPHNFTLYMAGRKRQRRCEQCPGCISIQTAINVSFVWTSLRMVDQELRNSAASNASAFVLQKQKLMWQMLFQDYTILVVRGLPYNHIPHL